MESCFGVKGLRETMILHCLAKTHTHTHSNINTHNHIPSHTPSIQQQLGQQAEVCQTLGCMCTFAFQKLLSNQESFLETFSFSFFHKTLTLLPQDSRNKRQIQSFEEWFLQINCTKQLHGLRSVKDPVEPYFSLMVTFVFFLQS